MSRYRIQIDLWPRNSCFEGKRISTPSIPKPENSVSFDIEIADAELLAAEWSNAPSKFEMEAARSIRAALREREEQLAQEDMAHAGE